MSVYFSLFNSKGFQFLFDPCEIFRIGVAITSLVRVGLVVDAVPVRSGIYKVRGIPNDGVHFTTCDGSSYGEC